MSQAHGLVAVGGFLHDLELRVDLEECPQALPHNRVIVGDQDANRHQAPPSLGMRTRIHVP